MESLLCRSVPHSCFRTYKTHIHIHIYIYIWMGDIGVWCMRVGSYAGGVLYESAGATLRTALAQGARAETRERQSSACTPAGDDRPPFTIATFTEPHACTKLPCVHELLPLHISIYVQLCACPYSCLYIGGAHTICSHISMRPQPHTYMAILPRGRYY